MDETQPQQTPAHSLIPEVSADHHTAMGILCYLGILVVIPLFVPKDIPLVKFHIKQGLALFIIDIVVWFVLGAFIWQLWMLAQLINLGILVLVIMGIINVVKGRQQELPLVGSLAKYLTF